MMHNNILSYNLNKLMLMIKKKKGNLPPGHLISAHLVGVQSHYDSQR